MGDEVQASGRRYHHYDINHHDHHDQHDDIHDERAVVIHDHEYVRCADNDCGRNHIYIHTDDDLAARDDSNFDAGFDAGYGAGYHAARQPRGSGHYESYTGHAAHVGHPAIDAHLAQLARNRQRDDVDGSARQRAAARWGRRDVDRTEELTWTRWEDEFDSGVDEAESGGWLAVAIAWSLTLVVGLAFWTAVGVIAWKLLT